MMFGELLAELVKGLGWFLAGIGARAIYDKARYSHWWRNGAG